VTSRFVFAAGSTAWRDQAECRTVDPELFFPISTTAEGLRQTERAKQVCWLCPVQAECLAWAVQTGQPSGIWGGLSEQERDDLYGIPEQSMTRCLNRQEWIEEQLAAGQSQAAVARELRVDTRVFRRALQRMRDERGVQGQVGEEAEV
jgi:WhiB family redox-sensing transcriptional regulator